MNFLSTIANNRLWNKHSLKLAWLLAILVLALVFMSVGWTAWQQTKIKQTNYQEQTISPIRTASRPTYRINDIVAANLFGNPTPAPVAKVAPKTTLDLTLVGVLWSSDNSAGRAIIMSGKKASELYSVDEEIEGAGAKVEEIRDAEVILNRNGALESLALNKLTDSNNRIVVTNPDDLIENLLESELEQSNQNPAPNTRQTASRNIVEQATDSAETQRVRRPNFSGLDRALEKIGDL